MKMTKEELILIGIIIVLIACIFVVGTQ